MIQENPPIHREIRILTMDQMTSKPTNVNTTVRLDKEIYLKCRGKDIHAITQDGKAYCAACAGAGVTHIEKLRVIWEEANEHN